MIKSIILCFLLFSLALPASAMEIEAPSIPEYAQEQMPDETESFAQGFRELLQKALMTLRPDLKEACSVSLSIIAAVMLVSFLKSFSDNVKTTLVLAGTTVIAAALLLNTNAMIRLGADTVQQLSDYGKMFYPVMATALAAQGGVTSSAALYTGTAVFDTILSSVISRILMPMVYVFLALSTAHNALGEDTLKKMRDLAKNTVSWCLKTLLTVFTTYMSITGVVSGTTDAAALKATRVTISSVVPVVGGILSDASEAVLVSADVMKNAAGVYGILAILALFVEPFLRIGIHYLILKATAAVCSVLGTSETTGIIEDFSSAMGMLLGMTGSVCLMLLISTVCFMKGAT